MSVISLATRPGQLTRSNAASERSLDDTARGLDEELLLSAPLVLERLGGAVEVSTGEIVEHDDVGAGGDGLVSLSLVLALDVDKEREAGNATDGLDRVRNRASCPDVVVLQHDHRREVVTVRVDTTDEHAVLLDKAEAGSRLAGTSDQALPSLSTSHVAEPPRDGSDTAAASEEVESDTLAKEKVARLSADDGALRLLSVGDRGALLDEPLNTVNQLCGQRSSELHRHETLIHYIEVLTSSRRI